jgi:RecJ-like exonuclease
MTEKICPECNGEGIVDQGTEDESRCPTCNGSGIVPDDGDADEVWNTHQAQAKCHRRTAVRRSPLGRRIVVGIAVAHQARFLRARRLTDAAGGRFGISLTNR